MQWPAWPGSSAVKGSSLWGTHFPMVSKLTFNVSLFFSFYRWYFVCHLEPAGLTVDNIYTTSFRVSFKAPSGNKEINRFEISVEGGCLSKACTLDKSESPLECYFYELLPATRYAVKVRSCLPLSIGCSSNATVLAITIPNREFGLQLSQSHRSQ